MVSVGDVVRIGKREFTVTETKDAADVGRAIYILTGKRGACYGTMRNVNRPEVMFLVHAKGGFGIPSGLDRVRLTDRNGTLEVL